MNLIKNKYNEAIAQKIHELVITRKENVILANKLKETNEKA